MQINDSISSAIARTYARGISGPNGSLSAAPATNRAAAGRPRTDSVSLSSTTQELLRLRGAAAEAPDVRSERVAALKNAIASGTYKVDLQGMAAKLLG